MAEDIYSLDVEQHCLGGLLNDSSILPEIDFFVKETDFFQKVHQTIYLVLRGMLLAAERVDPVLLANKISSTGCKFHGDLSIFEYVEMLSYKKPTKEATIQSYKELLGYRIRRVGIDKLREMARLLQRPGDKKISELVGTLDKLYTEWSQNVLKVHGRPIIEIASGIEDLIEERRNNPPDESKMMLGPFPTINNVYGSLSELGGITVVGARSGVGKTSMGLFYNVYLAERFSWPILWLDSSEMSVEQLQFRTVCMLGKGKIPLYSLKSGEWAKNEEWSKIVREVLPRTKKIKFYYESTYGLKTSEIIKLIRNFSYRIGKDQKFLICLDYLKSMDGDNPFDREWVVLGDFINDIKNFVQNEIPLPFWTSLQLNRSGITTNKKKLDIQDNEGAFGMSDRILQQASHAFILRHKLHEELEEENGQFGNMAAIFLKHRDLGKEASIAMRPIKLPDNSYAKNHINLYNETFWFEDRGLYSEALMKMKNKYDLKDKKPKNLEDGDIL